MFLGAVVFIVVDQYFGERENISPAVRTLSQLVDAMNRKDEPALNAMLGENIVMKDVSGEITTEWMLTRHDLVTRVTQNEIKSIIATNPRVQRRGEKVDVQVFVRTTFGSDAKDFYHFADDVFTFVRVGEDWKLIEITRDVSPLTFWQLIRNAPDVLIRKMLGIGK